MVPHLVLSVKTQLHCTPSLVHTDRDNGGSESLSILAMLTAMLLKVLQLHTEAIRIHHWCFLSKMHLAQTPKKTTSIMEVAIAYTGIENVTLGLGYYFDNQSDTNNEIDVLNVHASTSLENCFSC